MNALTVSEVEHLEKLEKVVQRGKKAFLQVGNALKEIRDAKLYRSTHGTFAKYVEQRFGFKRHNAMLLIQAAEVVENVDHGQQITSERHAREVAKAPPEKQQAVVDRAQEIAEQQDKPPTAATFREARKQVLLDVDGEEVLPLAQPSPDKPKSDLPDDDQVEDKFDEPVVRSFKHADYRLNTLKMIFKTLEPHELIAAKGLIEAVMNT